MRINRFIALATGLSRRAADRLIEDGEIIVNDQPPSPGQDIDVSASTTDTVMRHGQRLSIRQTQTILFNKPAGYVVSRDGQGSDTIYGLLPSELHHLKPVGRLDKYSSGLLLLTNDGELAQSLTHPSHQKVKVYEIKINQPLAPLHRQMISDIGIQLEDGPSRFELERIEEAGETKKDTNDMKWRVRMHEGRNRQIRRTFKALGYHVTKLHRTDFGEYVLEDLAEGKIQTINTKP